MSSSRAWASFRGGGGATVQVGGRSRYPRGSEVSDAAVALHRPTRMGCATPRLAGCTAHPSRRRQRPAPPPVSRTPPLPAILKLWLERTGSRWTKGQPQLQDREEGCGGLGSYLAHGNASTADSRVPEQPAGQAARRGGSAADVGPGEPAQA